MDFHRNHGRVEYIFLLFFSKICLFFKAWVSCDIMPAGAFFSTQNDTSFLLSMGFLWLMPAGAFFPTKNDTSNLCSEPFSETSDLFRGFPQNGVNTKKNRGEIPCRGAYKLNSNHFSKAQWWGLCFVGFLGFLEPHGGESPRGESPRGDSPRGEKSRPRDLIPSPRLPPSNIQKLA